MPGPAAQLPWFAACRVLYERLRAKFGGSAFPGRACCAAMLWMCWVRGGVQRGAHSFLHVSTASVGGCDFKDVYCAAWFQCDATTPPPEAAGCKCWCAGSTETWDNLCAKDNCAECPECVTPGCKSWCAGSTKTWQVHWGCVFVGCTATLATRWGD